MTYLTKAENLKVSLDKSRRAQLRRSTGWKGMAVFVGMCLWHVSVLGQCLWHFMGIMSLRTPHRVNEQQVFVSLRECFTQVAILRDVNSSCLDSMTESVPRFLQAGLLSFWWNNRIRDSLRGYGRLSYLNDYYVLQVIFLGIRYAAYWILSKPEEYSLPVPILAVHAFMIIFSLTVRVKPYRLLTLIDI
jgi:hypothetical protein